MSESRDTLLAAVEHVARLSGDVALTFFLSQLLVWYKSDGSPGTFADREHPKHARSGLGTRLREH